MAPAWTDCCSAQMLTISCKNETLCSEQHKHYWDKLFIILKKYLVIVHNVRPAILPSDRHIPDTDIGLSRSKLHFFIFNLDSLSILLHEID